MIFLWLQTHFKPNLEYQKVPTLHCQIFCQSLNANHQEFLRLIQVSIKNRTHLFLLPKSPTSYTNFGRIVKKSPTIDILRIESTAGSLTNFLIKALKLGYFHNTVWDDQKPLYNFPMKAKAQKLLILRNHK